MVIGPRHHGQEMGGDCEPAATRHTESVTIIVTNCKDVNRHLKGCLKAAIARRFTQRFVLSIRARSRSDGSLSLLTPWIQDSSASPPARTSERSPYQYREFLLQFPDQC